MSDENKLRQILDSMCYNGRMQVYFLNRESADKYRLQVHHKINGTTRGVLMDIDYPNFNVEKEVELLKKAMIRNYEYYLE